MSQLIDKFNCIDENKRDKKLILENLENYFENYFQNSNKVLLYDYMLQAINFNSEVIYSEELYKIIFTQTEEYISSVRNNMRASIKKNLFNLDSGLNKFFIDFKTKLDFIISFTDRHLNHTDINNLLDIIINDIYIKNFIEINIERSDDIISIYNTLKKYNFALQSKFIQILGDIHKKDLITKSDYPLPENLKRLYDFNTTLFKVNAILDKYVSIDVHHKWIITRYLYESIIIDFKTIINKNNLNEINLFIKNNYLQLLKILNCGGIQSNQTVLTIKTDILLLFSQSIIFNETFDIMDIIYIIDFAKQISSYKKDSNSIIYNNIIKKIVNLPNINNKLFDILELNLRNYKNDNNFRICKIITNILINNNNKDEFIRIYYKNLLKRLLDNYNNLSFVEFNNYILHETILYNIMKVEPTLGQAITYHISKLINDFKESNKLKQAIKRQLSCNINSPLVSINSEINVMEGNVSSQVIKGFNSNLAVMLNQINTCYVDSEIINRNKSIIWLPHFGEVTIVYMNTEIKLLPIQMLILELYTNIDFIFETELLASPYLKNYSTDFKNKLLESFVKGKLLIKVNNTYVLNNMPNFANDFISIFYSLSNMNTKWEELKEIEMVHSRQDITIANINSLLKNSKYNYQDIFKKLKEGNKLFILDDKILDESLKIMLDKDYIVFNTTTSLFEKTNY